MKSLREKNESLRENYILNRNMTGNILKNRSQSPTITNVQNPKSEIAN